MKMLLDKEFILLWNHTAIKVLDVRFMKLTSEEIERPYKLPASMFLYSIGGSAEIQLDFTKYTIDGFHLIHGGKGSTLKILSVTKELEYYVIFYRASLPLSLNQRLASLLQRKKPFQSQYSFIPYFPIPLFEKIRRMNKEWKNSNEIERFTVKSLFYQFINEIFKQLYQEKADINEPAFSIQVKRYITENYSEPLTLESIAQSLNYSTSYLSIQFKQSTGCSPIDYFIQVRIEKARILLIETNVSLREIAANVGYHDVYYFSRLFKKRVGVSPGQFRRKEEALHKLKDSPSISERYSIVGSDFERYIENGYQHTRKKDEIMSKKNKSSIAALLLCFTLLLSACSGGATVNNLSTGETQTTSKQTLETQPQTRVVSTIKGDVEVPINAERVVVLFYIGDVLSFGITPVGYSSIYDGAAFEEELTDNIGVGTWFEPNAEAVIDLNPDLIIMPDNEELYLQMEKIAPTIVLSLATPMDERLKKIGEVLGKDMEAKELLNQFHEKVEDSKKKLQDAGIFDKTVSIMEGGKGTMSVATSYGFGRGSQIIYEYLGMKGPESIRKEIEASKDNGDAIEVSLEILPDYAGDYVFRSSYEGMVDLTSHPVWNSIPAVKEGRLIEFDFGLAYYSDLYSLDKQLDFVVESLLATVK